MVPKAEVVANLDRDRRFDYRSNAIFRALRPHDPNTPHCLRVLRLFLSAYGDKVVAVKSYVDERVCAVSFALVSPEYLQRFAKINDAAIRQKYAGRS